ncbi:MAG: hypothetical protein QOH63_1964 [Acidobacteriota bacterium]|jgi:hypothetical protein|nr:hypothetical protein [Acidobacteriota bacterium]
MISTSGGSSGGGGSTTLSQVTDVTATAAEVNRLHGVKRYVALLSQSGTDAPTAAVLENSVGAIVWTRTDGGIYTATLSGAFPANKTTPCSGVVNLGNNFAYFGSRTDNNTWTLMTGAMGDFPQDDVLTGQLITIIVYP